MLMSSNPDIMQRIRDKLAANELDDALELFSEINKDWAIVMHARLQRTEHDASLGLITYGVAGAERSAMVKSLLEELSRMEE